MKHSTSLLRLMLVAGLFVIFSGYSFINASTIWTAPNTVPPNGNVDAPVNLGTDTQIKSGDLGVDNLSVIGNLGITSGHVVINNTADTSMVSYLQLTNASTTRSGYVSLNSLGTAAVNVTSSSTASMSISASNDGAAGYLKITAGSPYIQFSDTDDGSIMSRLLYGLNSYYIQSDRNGDGSYDNPNPFTLYVGSTSTSDWARYAGSVRASKYCDYNGLNCTTPGVSNGVLGFSTYSITTNPQKISGATCSCNAGDALLSCNNGTPLNDVSVPSSVPLSNACSGGICSCATAGTPARLCQVTIHGAVQDDGDTSDPATWHNTTQVVYWPEGSKASVAVYKGTQNYYDSMTVILLNNQYDYDWSSWHTVSGYIYGSDTFSVPGGAYKQFTVTAGATASIDNISSSHYDAITDATVGTCK